jgi:hypothetical protein
MSISYKRLWGLILNHVWKLFSLFFSIQNRYKKFFHREMQFFVYFLKFGNFLLWRGWSWDWRKIRKKTNSRGRGNPHVSLVPTIDRRWSLLQSENTIFSSNDLYKINSTLWVYGEWGRRMFSMVGPSVDFVALYHLHLF